ncbi:MAG: hypothetical protein JST26_05825 [Bacteroidetes bacterium]|nr:hypothetical protein [Bacteroidota bacterium]
MKPVIKIAIFLMLSFTLKAHTYTCRDTIIVFIKNSNYLKNLSKNFDKGRYKNDTVYFVRKGKVAKTSIDVLTAFNKSAFYSCKDKSKFKYSMFYNVKGKLIAETIWKLEGFLGSYREYYENGKLKVSGEYNGDQKTGIWREYDVNGNVIKEKNYNTPG